MAGTGPILVLDDSPTMAATIRLTLEQAGYPVEAFVSLEQALELLSNGPCRAVVVDHGPPEWTKALADRSHDVPVVALVDATLANGSIPPGATAAVHKPFRTHELVGALAELLGAPEDATATPQKKVGAWFKRLLGMDE